MITKDQTALIVDDETYVLRSLQRALRNENFLILTANSGGEALRILECESVDLIISDLRMPGMDGSELLRIVAERYPGMPRILLSGNADLPSVVKTVNEGQLSYYFQKPWDDDAIRLTLREFLKRKKLEEMERALNVKVKEQNEELLHLNQKLEKQADLILRETEMKSRFFSTLSHEIRTPLNGFLGVLQLMRDGIGTAQEQKTLLATSYATALDLKKLADDVLDYSKLESNKMELESIAFEPAGSIALLIQLMTPVAQAKALSIECAIDTPDNLTLIGDPLRLRQIVSNLLSNAIKYTKAGCVRLEMSYATNRLVIKVIDTGIGISADRQRLLFQEFQMLDPTHHRKYGGTGLGLSIAKRLADQMNGDIQVDSSVGKGTCFTVSLPLKITADPMGLSKHDITDLTGSHLLIVDDNEANVLIVKSAVEKAGATSVTADNGLSAIRILQQMNKAFDAILLDINMPGIDGVETLRIIRDENLADCPVFALTAQVDAVSIERLETLEFESIISKPIDLKHLCLTLAPLSLRTQSSENLPINASHEDAGAFDKTAFDALLNSTGHKVAKLLVDSFIRDCDKRSAIIAESLETSDSESIARQAHALINSAAMFGAMSLFRLCQKLDAEYKATGQCHPEDYRGLIPLISASKSTISHWLDSLQH
ncbi:MAG: signal transduction histidine kinase [Candidatus Azotimanducaceae bacterium]|jgi:signal transduction histidine kinase/HPt (histidine-containing phosphotransfer) domain-containing protein